MIADPAQVRRDLVAGRGAGLWRRRAIVAASLVGGASMAAVSLLQTGVIGHLPDPPAPGFDSDKVNLSPTAFKFGVPDGPIALLSLAANLPLAALGGRDRAEQWPWVPLLFAAKAAADAAVAAWYFYQMPAKEKAWCGYCILGAFANFAVLALVLPEATRALQTVRGRTRSASVRPPGIVVVG